MLRHLAAALVVGALVVWARPLQAHDDEKAAGANAASLARVVETVRKHPRADELVQFLPECQGHLKEIAGHDLEHVLERAEEKEACPEEFRRTVQRVIRTVAIGRNLTLSSAELGKIAWPLASDEPCDWTDALLYLYRCDYDDKHERRIIALSADNRPEVRYMAGLLTKYAVLFKGPTKPLEVVALNLAVDKDPLVAAKFSADHGTGLRMKPVLARLMSRLNDNREVRDPDVGIFAGIGGRTVGESICHALWWKVGFGSRGPQPEHHIAIEEKARDLRAWWAKEEPRESVESATEKGWENVYDGVSLMPVGGHVTIETKGKGKVTAEILEWFELVKYGTPLVSFRMAVQTGAPMGAKRVEVGNPSHQMGWVAVVESDGVRVEAIPAPDLRGGVRVRWRLLTLTSE